MHKENTLINLSDINLSDYKVNTETILKILELCEKQMMEITAGYYEKHLFS